VPPGGRGKMYNRTKEKLPYVYIYRHGRCLQSWSEADPALLWGNFRPRPWIQRFQTSAGRGRRIPPWQGWMCFLCGVCMPGRKQIRPCYGGVFRPWPWIQRFRTIVYGSFSFVSLKEIKEAPPARKGHTRDHLLASPGSRLLASRLSDSCLSASRLSDSCLLASRLLDSCLLTSRLLDSRLLASRLLDSRLLASRLLDSCLLRVAGLRVAGRWVAGLWVAGRWVAGLRVAGRRVAGLWVAGRWGDCRWRGDRLDRLEE
jgi:hypothetical protein